MLARLQQLTTLGALMLAGLWAWAFIRAGQPRWAVAGALVLLFGYALVLALEFTLLSRVHGSDDPTPRATATQLLRAWWGEVLAAPTVFCWRQPFFSRRFADSLPPGAAGRRGVLLVHGFVCNRGLWNPWLERLRRSGVPAVAVNLEPVFGSIDDYAPLIDAAVRRLHEHTGVAPVIVAHSMGGLAVRRWRVECNGSEAGGIGADSRVHHVITLGTPHHGTWLARFAFSTNGAQMRRHGRWLQALAAREQAASPTDAAAPGAPYARFTCFYSHCDNIVFPPATATLPGADNRHLEGVAHVHMAEREEPWEELARRLAAPSA